MIRINHDKCCFKTSASKNKCAFKEKLNCIFCGRYAEQIYDETGVLSLKDMVNIVEARKSRIFAFLALIISLLSFILSILNFMYSNKLL